MLSLQRALTPRLVVPWNNQLASVMHTHDGQISLYKMSPDVPNDNMHIGLYPKSKAERIKAAKKYNLIPEDYEPYPEDEGWGDYPKLKPVGDYNRDKYDDYDEPWDFRFYGEPLQRDFDLWRWERLDPLEKEKPQFLPSYPIRFAIAFGIPGLLFAFLHYTKEYGINFNPQFKIRQPGYKYYSFPESPIDGTAAHLSHHN